MLPHAPIRPFLCVRSEGVVPGQRLRVVLGPVVVGHGEHGVSELGVGGVLRGRHRGLRRR